MPPKKNNRGGARGTQSSQSSNGPPDISSYLSFPAAIMEEADFVNFDIVADTVREITQGTEVPSKDFQQTMVSLLLHLVKAQGNVDKRIQEVEEHAKTNTERIKALEDKVGQKEECSIPLTITIHNLPKYPDVTDEESVKRIIEHIGAEGVDPVNDVKKIQRKGGNEGNGRQRASPGTVLVELSSAETRGKILRAKKVLANKTELGLKALRIDSMKSREQLNQEYNTRQLLRMIPGGDQLYLAASGALRPQTRPRPPHHGAHQPHLAPNHGHNQYNGPPNHHLPPRGPPPGSQEAPRAATPGAPAPPPGAPRPPPATPAPAQPPFNRNAWRQPPPAVCDF